MVGQAGAGEGVLGAPLKGAHLLARRLQLQSLLASSPERARAGREGVFGAVLQGAQLLARRPSAAESCCGCLRLVRAG
jgi:hypothetical protein